MFYSILKCTKYTCYSEALGQKKCHATCTSLSSPDVCTHQMTAWHIHMFVDATDHESRVGSLLLLKRRTENSQGCSCSTRPL